MLKRFLMMGLFLFGCQTRAYVAKEEPSRDSALTVSLQVEATASTALTRRTLAPGGELHSGDDFSLRIFVDRPVYVYAVQYSATGWSSRLFPAAGDRVLQPGSILALPDAGKTYHLDNNPGRERIYVVASTHPMGAATCARLRLRCAPSTQEELTRGEAPPPPPPPPPDGVPDRERRVELLMEEQKYTLRQRSDPNGLALLSFTFEHLP
jgi:hypothetical protein